MTLLKSTLSFLVINTAFSSPAITDKDLAFCTNPSEVRELLSQIECQSGSLSSCFRTPIDEGSPFYPVVIGALSGLGTSLLLTSPLNSQIERRQMADKVSREMFTNDEIEKERAKLREYTKKAVKDFKMMVRDAGGPAKVAQTEYDRISKTLAEAQTIFLQKMDTIPHSTAL